VAPLRSVEVAIAGGSAAPAVAQTTTPRRAAAANGSEDGQALDLTLSVTAVRDSDIPLEAQTLVNTDPVSTSDSTMFTGSGDYGWRSRTLQLRASGSSAIRHDRASGDIRPVSHTAAAGLTASLPLVTVFVNQTGAYSPSYLYALFPQAAPVGPGVAPPAAPDYATNDFDSYSYATQLTLTTTPTRRSSFSVSGESTRTDYQGVIEGQPDLDAKSASGQLTYRIGRSSSVNGRYRYRVGTFATGGGTILAGSTEEHGVDLGFAHARRFSRTRQLTVNVGLGSAVLMVPEAMRAQFSKAEPWRLQGQAAVTLDITRTWQANATYRRGIDYVAGLVEPIASEGATASVTGLLTRRLDVAATAAYSAGEAAVSRNGTTFDTYTGNARLRYTLTSMLSSYVEYLYYYYDFRGTALVTGIPRGLERNGLRAGVILRVSPFGR
jgi:hypothetical protein